MANPLSKFTSWAARAIEDYASKNNVSTQKAIEAIEDIYGQKIYSKTAKLPVEEFPADPARFLGKGNEADNRSLSEVLAAEKKAFSPIAPVSKEQSLVPYSKGETALVPVGKVTARSSEEIKLPNKMTKEVEERGKATSPTFDSGAKDKSLPRGTVMYSEGEINPLYLGKEPGKKWSPSKKQMAGFTTAGALGTFAFGDGYEEFKRKQQEAADSKQSPELQLTPSQMQQAKKNKDEFIQPEIPIQGDGIFPEGFKEEYAESFSKLKNKPTSEVKKDIKTRLAEADKIIKEPPPAALPEEIDRFKQQRDEAYQLFKEARDRNDWLQLAQILGQAFTQYGAAQVGMKTGRSMAGLQIPGIDYEARTAQEQKLLESRLRDVREEQEREDTLAERLKREKQWEREFGLKQRESAGKITAEEKAERKTTEKNLRDELDLAQKEKTAALSVANILVSQPDLSDNTLKKLEEKLPGLAAKAGITALDLKQIENDATKKGFIWDTLDKEEKNRLIQERVVDRAEAKVSNLFDKLKALETRGGTSKAPTAGPKQDPQILNYANLYNLSYNQAKEILVNRGYAPKE